MILRTPGFRPLLATTFVSFSGFSLLLPISPLWALEGGANEFTSGLVTTVLMVVTVLTQLNVNRLLARFGWTAIFSVGLIMLGLPALLQAVSSEPWLVLATSALRGIGFGIITVCGSTATSLIAPPNVRGRAIGLHGLAIAVPQVALMTASPWFAEVLGIQAAIMLGLVPIVGLAWVAPLGRAIHTHAETARGAETDAAETGPEPATAATGPIATAPDTTARDPTAHDASSRNTAASGNGAPSSGAGQALPRQGGASAPGLVRRIWIPVVALVLITASGGALLTFAPQIVPDAAGAVAVLFAITAVAAFTRWLVGPLIDRWGSRPFIWSLLAIGAVGLGAMAGALTLAAADSALGFIVLLAGACLLGAAYGGLQTATLVRAFTDGGESQRHRTSVVWNVGFDVGTGSGAVVVGAIAGASSFAAGFAVAGIACAVWAIAVGIREARRR